MTYSMGQYFEDKKHNEPYILALAGANHVALICLSDGKPWVRAVLVESHNAITEDEFKKIAQSGVSRFREISKEHAKDLMYNPFA